MRRRSKSQPERFQRKRPSRQIPVPQITERDHSGEELRLSAVEHGYIFKFNGEYYIVDYYGKRGNGQIPVVELKTFKRTHFPASSRVRILTKEEEYKCNLRLVKTTL